MHQVGAASFMSIAREDHFVSFTIFPKVSFPRAKEAGSLARMPTRLQMHVVRYAYPSYGPLQALG